MTFVECPTCHQSVAVDRCEWTGVAKLRRWFTRKSITTFTTREAMKGAFGGRGHADDVKIALLFLSSNGDIRALPSESRAERWQVVS